MIFKNFKSVILITFLFSSAGVAAEEIFTEYGTRISFKEFNKDYFAIRNYLRTVESCISRILKVSADNESDISCNIFLVGSKEGKKIKTVQVRNRLLIYLSPKFDDWKNDFDVLRKLISCFYLTKCGIALDVPGRFGSVPYWVQVGTVGFIKRKIKKNPNTFKSYPLLRSAEINGVELGVDDIVTGDVKTDDGVIFSYYAEACNMLMNLCFQVTSSRNNIFYEMIILTNRKKFSPLDVFYMTAGKRLIRNAARISKPGEKLSDREKIRIWFRLYCRYRLINSFMPLPVNIAERDFKALLKVDYIQKSYKDDNLLEKKCLLSDLGNKWKDVYNKKEVLSRLRNAFSALQRECAPEFIGVFSRLLHTFKSLKIDVVKSGKKKLDLKTVEKNGEDEVYKSVRPVKKKVEKYKFDPVEFKLRVDDAVKLFHEIAGRKREIEVYLEESEKTFVPLKEIYKYEFLTLEKLDSDNRKIWPKVNKYLDWVEKEYIEE